MRVITWAKVWGEKTKSTNKTKTSHYRHWGLKVKPLWDFAPSHDVLYWCYLKEGVSGGFCLFFKKWENHMWFHLTDWTKLNTKLQNITKIIKISEYYADYIYIYDWHWNCNYITIFTVEDVQMLRLCIYCTLCLVGWVAERDGRIQEWFPVPFSDADGQSRKVSETRFMQEKGLLHFC